MVKVRRVIVTTFLSVMAIGGCGGAAANASLLPTPLPPQARCAGEGDPKALCVVVLGDSTADGTPLTGDDRWWVQLGSLLGSALPDRHVVVDSWAVPGSRVDVLESAAHDQPALGSYDLAIVIEGVNDKVALPIDAWRPRYEAAIGTLEDAGLIAVVGTPPPGFENGTFSTRYDPTTAALREVAAGRRPLLDIDARWHADGFLVAATYYSDLIHQGPIGQRLMAETARDVVLEAVGGH